MLNKTEMTKVVHNLKAQNFSLQLSLKNLIKRTNLTLVTNNCIRRQSRIVQKLCILLLDSQSQ